MTKKSQNILELTIEKAAAHDMSLYTCKSQNDVGADSAEGHITILCEFTIHSHHFKQV